MLCRSSDGQLLIVSSSDGFCSIISFGKEELGVQYTDNSKVEVMETKEFAIQEDIEDILSKDIPLKTNLKKDKLQVIDLTEPPTKKRIQLVTLSSPKTKKYVCK